MSVQVRFSIVCYMFGLLPGSCGFLNVALQLQLDDLSLRTRAMTARSNRGLQELFEWPFAGGTAA